MSQKTMSLKAVAQRIGKSEKQVVRYVKSGRIEAQGGGHGVPWMFNRSDVERFKETISKKQTAGRIEYRQRRPWPGVVSGDDLGRMAYALTQKRADAACSWLPWWETTMLWKWAECGFHARAKDDKQRRLWRMQLDDGLRRLAPESGSVPLRFQRWTKAVAGRISPVEVDYIAAMIAVAAHPWKAREPGENTALSRAFGTMRNAGRSWKEEDRLHDSFFSGDIDALETLCGRRTADGEWNGGHFPELQESGILETLFVSVKKQAQGNREKRHGGIPTGSRVAILLGIHRGQGTRIVASIHRKLGEKGVIALFKMLGCPVPRAWKSKTLAGSRPRRKMENVLLCAGCDEPVAETLAYCPCCGRMQ